jgi:hypothetical protein
MTDSRKTGKDWFGISQPSSDPDASLDSTEDKRTKSSHGFGSDSDYVRRVSRYRDDKLIFDASGL